MLVAYGHRPEVQSLSRLQPQQPVPKTAICCSHAVPEPSAKRLNNGHDTRIVATLTFSRAKLEAATLEVSKSCRLRADSPAIES